MGLKTLTALNLRSSSREREWECEKELSVRDAAELEWAKCGDINRESAVDSKSEFLSICYCRDIGFRDNERGKLTEDKVLGSL